MRTLTLFCVLLVALPTPTRATVLVPADLSELSRDARAIVRGRVVRLDSQWTDDRQTVETMVTLEVEGYIKGSLGPTLIFRTPGGDLGRYRSVVVGAPAFSVDEHIIVFLGARGPSIPYVLGLSQGVFRVVRTDESGRWMVAPPVGINPATGSVPLVRGDVSRRPLPLTDFEQRVRALAGGAK